MCDKQINREEFTRQAGGVGRAEADTAKHEVNGASALSSPHSAVSACEFVEFFVGGA